MAWVIQAIEILLANKEQLEICLKDEKLIDAYFDLMSRYLVVKKKKISVDAIIFKSINRVFAMLMEREEAKKLVLLARGNQNNSREMIETFLTLSKEQWILLESTEGHELI